MPWLTEDDVFSLIRVRKAIIYCINCNDGGHLNEERARGQTGLNNVVLNYLEEIQNDATRMQSCVYMAGCVCVCVLEWNLLSLTPINTYTHLSRYFGKRDLSARYSNNREYEPRLVKIGNQDILRL